MLLTRARSDAGSQEPTSSVVLEMTPTEAAPGRARREVARRLGARLDPGLLADLQVVVTELVSNAVRHGPGTGKVSLALRTEGRSTVRGEVVDCGDGTGDIRFAASCGEQGGFGLRLVDRLTSRWGVYPGSTHVWFEIEHD